MSNSIATATTMTQQTTKTIMRKSPLDFLLTRSQQLGAIVFMGLYFQYFVYRTERLMDSYLKQHTFLQQLRDSIAPSPVKSPRFLVFEPIEESQGIGNIMNGLLAAHMLGTEFNRTVCVSKHWEDFHEAFHIVKNEEACASIADERRTARNTIVILNYASPPNECRLQTRLSADTSLLFFSANTYPRWADVPKDLSWDDHYEPTERLINIIPYKTRPSTVVHLRKPDDEEDIRSGLDDGTLQALGREMPADTFLVTNDVDWYNFFKSYGWTNPGWHHVKHSALQDIEWGSETDQNGESATAATVTEKEMLNGGILELWSDWYTILRADKVYHTHSDFSLSAIHWNNIESKTIQGCSEDGALILTDESWRVDEPMLRVVDRVDGERNNCDKMADDGFMMFDDVGGVDDISGFDDDGAHRETDDNPFSVKDRPPKEAWELSENFMQKEKPPDWTDDAQADFLNGVPKSDDEDPDFYQGK